MESILTSIKKMLGIVEECEDFDIDVMSHINTAFSTLHSVGVGPSEGFSIEDKNSTWADFSEDTPTANMAKSYIYHSAKLVFDPPPNSFVVESMKTTKSEYEWRLQVRADELKSTEEEVIQNGS